MCLCSSRISIDPIPYHLRHRVLSFLSVLPTFCRFQSLLSEAPSLRKSVIIQRVQEHHFLTESGNRPLFPSKRLKFYLRSLSPTLDSPFPPFSFTPHLFLLILSLYSLYYTVSYNLLNTFTSVSSYVSFAQFFPIVT